MNRLQTFAFNFNTHAPTTRRALYLVYMVASIVLSELSGPGTKLNSPLQLLRTSLVVIGVLFVCDNLGFQVKSLIAGEAQCIIHHVSFEFRCD